MKSILGTKVGMTQVFSTSGKKIPVTVVYIEPNKVLNVKTIDKNGYNAIQVGYYSISEKSLNKPIKGQFKKANSEPKRFIRELRDVSNYEVGSNIDCSIFEIGQYVDVQGITKGHGFTGSIKRHNFSMGPVGHGAGYPHRYVGSIAFGRGGSQGQRVIKGTKLPGHYGHETVTIKNLLIVDIQPENNILLVQGAVPGPKNGLLKIKSSINKANSKFDIEIINRNKKQDSKTINNEPESQQINNEQNNNVDNSNQEEQQSN